MSDNTTVPPRPSSVYAVKRTLEATLNLPRLKQHGFTHPRDGFWTMIPQEFDLVLAFESPKVSQVILVVMRQTVGYIGNGPGGRREWVRLSYADFAREGLMARSTAQDAVLYAVKEGYLRRQRVGRQGWEYAIKWKGITN